MVNKASVVSVEHSIFVQNRNVGSFKGIIDAPSFDQGEIILESDLGAIVVRGEGLSVKRLNLEKGEVDIEGHIDSIVYTKSKSKRNKEAFFKRLLK